MTSVVAYICRLLAVCSDSSYGVFNSIMGTCACVDGGTYTCDVTITCSLVVNYDCICNVACDSSLLAVYCNSSIIDFIKSFSEGTYPCAYGDVPPAWFDSDIPNLRVPRPVDLLESLFAGVTLREFRPSHHLFVDASLQGWALTWADCLH